MYIPKRYGMSKIDACPFCQKNATTMNSQKVPVCAAHKQDQLDGLKCICGASLDILNGKFGVFFSCMKCGNISLKKVLEFNDVKPKAKVVAAQRFSNNSSNNSGSNNASSNKSNNNTNSNNKFDNTRQNQRQPTERKEIIVRSDDPRYFD